MNSKIFSYKVEGVHLERQTDQLKLSKTFDRKVVLEQLKELFAAENYKVDEGSLNYEIIEDQLFIQGLAIENQEPKQVGFRFGSKN